MQLVRKFEAIAKDHHDKAAVIYLGTEFSYAKLKELINRFTYGLYRLGVRENHKILMYIPNCPQWLIAYYGIQKLGAVPVPISPIYTPYELEYIANDSGARGIICMDTNFGYATRVLPQTELKWVIVTTLVELLPRWKRAFGYAFDRIPRGRVALDDQTRTFRSVIKMGLKAMDVGAGVRSNPLACLFYTSGTTGVPKGIPAMHRLLLSSTDDSIEMWPEIRKGEQRLLLVLSLFHIFPQTLALICLHLGCPIVLFPKVNIDAMLEAIKRYKITLFAGVPALYRMILEHDRLDLYDLHSLKYCFSAGDVLPLEVSRRWKERFNIPIYQVYGSTEVDYVSISPLDREPPPGSVGIPIPSRAIKIVDPETLEPVPPGQVGELLVTTESLAEGYWNKPEETARSFVRIEGKMWYRMGDLVRIDQDGHLHFEERRADIIKYKGYRVAASEIEAALQDHPAVVEACVIGVPDDLVGERIKAFVVLREDVKGVTAYELIKWCRERLVPYKIPGSIEFRDMLPKSKVGKLLRRELRDEQWRRIEGQAT